MTFTIRCNQCQEEQEFKTGSRPTAKHIEVGVTENMDIVGVSVETIDIYCSNCSNEANM